MRISRLFPLVCLLVLACLALGVSASNWDKDDHEIFELQNALEESEGKGTTFYSILGVPKTATQADIKRAYRKKSLEMHPDKNQGVRDAQKRFERLGLINKILRDSRKDRYDHFLTNGFPKWRGTGYFYERFRPGLGSVLVGLVLFSMAIEVLIKTLNARQEREKMVRLKRSAMLVAWGPRFEQHLLADKLEKTLLEKKVKVPLAGFPDLPSPVSPEQVKGGNVDWDEQEKKLKRCILSASQPGAVVAARSVDVFVSQQEVLVDLQGEWWPLDEEAIVAPSFKQTWPVRCFQALVGKKHANEEQQEEEKEAAQVTEQKAKDVIADGGARKRKGKKK
ncbi:hypothetical protein ACQY0O_004272 [Thecaphora frezii]